MKPSFPSRLSLKNQKIWQHLSGISPWQCVAKVERAFQFAAVRSILYGLIRLLRLTLPAWHQKAFDFVTFGLRDTINVLSCDHHKIRELRGKRWNWIPKG